MREAQRVRRRNITIAAILALVFVLAAGIWAYTGVTGSYYLGTYQGNVAVCAAYPASRSDSSSTGSKAKPALSCPTCPKTRKTASRRAFRKQVSTMRRTRYPSTATRSTRSRPAR